MVITRRCLFKHERLSYMEWSIVIARLVLMIWVGTVAYADDQMMRISNTADLTGTLVKDPEGKVLGRIQDVVFHWRSDGYTEYAVLSLGGFWREGDRQIAVPRKALMPNPMKDHFVLNMNQVQLNEDPELVAYRLYDRSFVGVLGAARSPAASSAPAMMDHSASAEHVWETRLFSIQHVMESELTRERS